MSYKTSGSRHILTLRNSINRVAAFMKKEEVHLILCILISMGMCLLLVFCGQHIKRAALQVVDALQAEGYTFVTVEEILFD